MVQEFYIKQTEINMKEISPKDINTEKVNNIIKMETIMSEIGKWTNVGAKENIQTQMET